MGGRAVPFLARHGLVRRPITDVGMRMKETRRPEVSQEPTTTARNLHLAVCQTELMARVVEQARVSREGDRLLGSFDARIRDDVLHITGFTPSHDSSPGAVGTTLQCPLYLAANPERELTAHVPVFATYDPTHQDQVRFWLSDFQTGQATTLQLTTFSPAGDLFARVDSIFETQMLSHKLVTVIGVGSGGSLLSIELARCGVRRFCLIDFDRLEPHNVARHACAVSDIGRFKTRAVRDLLLDINPLAEVSTHDFDILSESEEERLRSLIRSSDLVLACTDTERSKYRINLICLQESVPAIYAGAYERAFGGDVMRVDPGRDKPCYDCVVGTLQESFEDRPRGPIPYSSIASLEEYKAEPGLGLDLHFIVLIQAKMALLTLLRGTDSRLEDLDHNYILWGNRKEWIFAHPFDCRMVTIRVRKDCPTHQLVFENRDGLVRTTGRGPIPPLEHDGSLFKDLT